MNSLDRLLTRIGDALLDWVLPLPRDLVVLLLAAILITLLLGLRRLLSDRDALHQLMADERRLKQLQSEARSAGDQAALQRHRRVRRMLAARRVRLELLPALVGLFPALLVLHWGARRLEYLPLTTNQTFTIEATFPAPMTGRPVHLVPDATLTVEPGWIQIVGAVSGNMAQGAVGWELTGSASGATTMTLRHPAGTAQVPLEIGTGKYAPPAVDHPGGVSTRVELAQYRPLGIVPPLRWLGLPAWGVGLLLLSVPGYLLCRRGLQMP